jgi:SAM-dependent methyltransferase
VTGTETAIWQEAGRAWGRRAVDWAYLFEPYCVPAYHLVLPRAGAAQGARLLDVACGSGLAVTFARRLGADVWGIDASTELVEVARERVPDGDFRAGDMFALPFASGFFDVVTSFNGIWFGGDEALAEIERVLRPGGTAAITFWGDPSRIDHAAYFLAVASCSAPSEGAGVIDLGKIAEPGVAERMLADAGLQPQARSTVRCASEWPDRTIAAKAMAAPGVAEHAIRHSGLEAFLETALEAIEPFHTANGYRLESDIDYVIATKPIPRAS